MSCQQQCQRAFRCLSGPEHNTSEWGWTSENQVLGDITDTALHLGTSASLCNSTTTTLPDSGHTTWGW